MVSMSMNWASHDRVKVLAVTHNPRDAPEPDCGGEGRKVPEQAE